MIKLNDDVFKVQIVDYEYISKKEVDAHIKEMKEQDFLVDKPVLNYESKKWSVRYRKFLKYIESK